MSAKQIRRPTTPPVHVERHGRAVKPDPGGNREQRRAARKLGLKPGPSAEGGERSDSPNPDLGLREDGESQ